MFRRTVSAFTLIAALGGIALIPSTALAQAGVELKFYDRSHKDYHQWNDGEDVHYRQYLTEHHRKYHEFDKLKKKQQDEYWQWRHNHS